ncbi:hypothetical protein [Shewanella surugensis]|uniref:Uncharacterized protein n=1 Tax=Shewanella surugensis TaxID=212020 RepID=A0ABT0LHX1_9GAMM|nr:hypothetical protein [Shewanella surugensis]MCL1127265.1 hypothetical protein [Shewanella surugensis]
MSNAITWNNQVKDYFTQIDIGCMRSNRLNLASYEDVKANAADIHSRVKSGNMPKGGKRWPDSQIINFEQWMLDSFPED